MKRSPAISSVESKAAFREKMIENFVQQNLPPGSPKQNKLSGMGSFAVRYMEIESCAAETPVMGNVKIFFASGFFNTIREICIPVSSRFFVFCTRDDDHAYKVAWSSSLS